MSLQVDLLDCRANKLLVLLLLLIVGTESAGVMNSVHRKIMSMVRAGDSERAARKPEDIEMRYYDDGLYRIMGEDCLNNERKRRLGGCE